MARTHSLVPNSEPDSPPPEKGSDVHLHIGLILDHAWLLALTMVLAIVAAAIYVQRATRIYEATTTLQVEQEEQKVVKVEQVLKEDLRGLEILNTIAQKLRGRALMERALVAKNFLPAEGQPTTMGDKAVSREEFLSQFERKVKATLRRNTRLIDVSVRDSDPKRAAELANGLLEQYLGLDTLNQSTTTKGAYAFLKEEAARLGKKLEDSEAALQAYRKEVGSVSLEQSQNIIAPQLRDISARLTQAKVETIRTKTAYDDILTAGTNVTELLAYPQIATDPSVIDAAAAVSHLENELALVRQRYREKHPKYILAIASLEGAEKLFNKTVLATRARVQEAFRVPYQNSLAMERGLEASVKSSEEQALQLSQQAIRFNLLSRELESDRAMFDSVISRLKETSLTKDLTPEKIRVIQAAFVPEKPVSPKAGRIFALALLGGLGLGLAIVFFLNLLDTSLTNVEEAEELLHLPVLSSVPRLPGKDQAVGHLVAAEGSSSIGAEVFRTLRTSLSMLGREEGRRTCLFTSSLPGEGKSFTSINYAATLAQQGLRTLIIDADLRRPDLELFFRGKVSHSPGLVDYLLGRKKLAELVQRLPNVDNLCWISAGSSAPNPSELLGQDGFQKLLDEALEHFDRVVVDTAPIHPVSDTLLIADKVQTVVLVVHGGKTPRRPVLRAVQSLINSGATMGGVVLNLLPRRRKGGGYYYSHYDGYGYGHDGRKAAVKGGKESTVKAREESQVEA